MSRRNRVGRRVFVDKCVVSALAVSMAAIVAHSASAQTARQRATFNVQGNTVIGLTGEATGILNDNNPTASKLSNELLSPQIVGAFEVSYTGTVTADISFNTTTHAITGIHVANAHLVAGNNGDWKPGNWDGATFGNGASEEAGNYGGTVLGLINLATRGLTLNVTNRGAVFPVAAGGNFTVNTGQVARFTGGNMALYSTIDSGGLLDSNDALTTYDGFEVDLAAVQPAEFHYTDDMGMHTLQNPLAGQLYPSGIVWRYLESNTNVPVYHADHTPVLDGNNVQITTNIRTYGELAPGFETSKGGLQSGTNPPNVDKDWFRPDDDTVGKPNVVRTYVDSAVWFDINGNPLQVRADLDLPNAGVNLENVVYDGFGNIISSTAVSSNITATLNGETGKYDASLAMNLDATARTLLGNFAVSLKIGQAKNVFDELAEDTGRIIADAALSLKEGDVNNDGIVNIFDINLVSGNWSPKADPDFYAGDANNDGLVNIFDINLISSNWSLTQPPPGAAAAVPEPSTLVLATLGVAALGLGLGRRRVGNGPKDLGNCRREAAV